MSALKAPTNEYESLRAGIEYKLAMQAIRKLVRTSKDDDYTQAIAIAEIIKSMMEDVERRCDDGPAT